MKCGTLFVFCLICGASLFGQSTSTTEQKQEPPSGTPGSERLVRVCDPKNPIAPCATAPRPVFTADPEYSQEARDAHYEGSCVLWMIVGSDGKPRNIKVVRTLGLGLDEKAIEAVKQWKFEPGMMDGKPVAVQVNLKMSFRLDEAVHLSPRSAQVVTGSQQQFALVSTQEAPIAAANWSVSGSGCVASACGSISPEGLYTAPLTVPNPATVRVTATAATDPTKNGSAQVTILPSPSR